MLDAVVALTDLVTTFWSMGVPAQEPPALVLDAFRADDGWFVLQVGREAQFRALLDLVGRPDLLDDERLAARAGWAAHTDDVLRPVIEAWAAGQTRQEACAALAAAGLAAGPCLIDAEVVADPHLASRNMLVAMDRPDGVEQPVLVPGNPVKIDGLPEADDTRVPWLGEHTDAVLGDELGLDAAALADLRAAGVVA
jgi:crotonobetainyl-CoA:carnitine CoA-transferase CaiB-like acyl-CoA transferase